ncbi:MAG: hypothetical protein LBS14_00330 [Holosporaceae bacterium]|jgi:hypothetical protein|nr:hypothetical protein [Holosporaceae bacterium]
MKKLAIGSALMMNILCIDYVDGGDIKTVGFAKTKNDATTKADNVALFGAYWTIGYGIIESDGYAVQAAGKTFQDNNIDKKFAGEILKYISEFGRSVKELGATARQCAKRSEVESKAQQVQKLAEAAAAGLQQLRSREEHRDVAASLEIVVDQLFADWEELQPRGTPGQPMSETAKALASAALAFKKTRNVSAQTLGNNTTLDAIAELGAH